MGIYDRDYVRDEPRGFHLGSEMGMVAKLVIATVAVYVLDQFTSPVRGDLRWLSSMLAVEVDTLAQPLEWWRFFTYGFAHDPGDIGHIFWNMLGLFFLGRVVEARYGAMEFLRLYVAMIVVAGVSWAVLERLIGGPANGNQSLIGASGAVAGVVTLLALNFPRMTLLLFFVLPVPAWLVGILVVASDLWGAVQRTGNVAFTAHLAGAAFAIVYFYAHWHLGSLLPGRISWLSLRRWRTKSRLRVHRPTVDNRRLSDEVDRILEKISREGEASLTSAERRTLQDASRHYQDRSKKS